MKEEQKLVMVGGVGSFPMIGDNLEECGYKGDDAVPALLRSGWTIKSIHLSENLTSHGFGEPTGYVIMEK